MKTIVLYYSFSGKTKKLAAQKAAELGADIEEIVPVRKPSKLGAYTAGIVRAMQRKATAVKPFQSDLNGYDTIVLMAPIWASHPAPAFNGAVGMLPSGKKVELIMVSASEKSEAEGTKALVAARGCEVTGYTDIKG